MNNSKIDSIFLVNEISATLIIPYDVARKKGLNNPENVVVEEMNEGILIRRTLEDRKNEL